jgi:hypothetical protein
MSTQIQSQSDYVNKHIGYLKKTFTIPSYVGTLIQIINQSEYYNKLTQHQIMIYVNEINHCLTDYAENVEYEYIFNHKTYNPLLGLSIQSIYLMWFYNEYLLLQRPYVQNIYKMFLYIFTK